MECKTNVLVLFMCFDWDTALLDFIVNIENILSSKTLGYHKMEE